MWWFMLYVLQYFVIIMQVSENVISIGCLIISFIMMFVVRKLLYKFWLVVSMCVVFVFFGVLWKVFRFSGWVYRNIFNIRKQMCSRVMSNVRMSVIQYMGSFLDRDGGWVLGNQWLCGSFFFLCSILNVVVVMYVVISMLLMNIMCELNNDRFLCIQVKFRFVSWQIMVLIVVLVLQCYCWFMCVQMVLCVGLVSVNLLVWVIICIIVISKGIGEVVSIEKLIRIVKLGISSVGVMLWCESSQWVRFSCINSVSVFIVRLMCEKNVVLVVGLVNVVCMIVVCWLQSSVFMFMLNIIMIVSQCSSGLCMISFRLFSI